MSLLIKIHDGQVEVAEGGGGGGFSATLSGGAGETMERKEQPPQQQTPERLWGQLPQADFSKPNNPVSLRPLRPLEPSNRLSEVSGGTADVLPAERAKASFDVETMMNILDGGKKKTQRRRFIWSPSKGMDASNKYYLEREDLLPEHIRFFMAVHDKYLGNFVPTREDVAWMSAATMHKGSLMNHFGLYLITLLGMASDEQKGWWLVPAFLMKNVGCYAQTELGHGSNVRGLQTTATFDKDTEEFVLHTPHLLASKWWPGTLGKVATHALVFAQLILDGKEYGVHVFMLQIRDDNHRPLPGIELGDLGPKMGDDSNDTGFMRLDRVRIPRSFMLARFQRVTPEGRYEKDEKRTNDKLHYATMMMTRGSMVASSGATLARAVTIATRYSLVRKQGFVDTSPSASFSSPEMQIIDYQVQRFRIFKQLGLCYAIKATGKWMTEAFAQLEGDQAGVIEDTTALPELAATSAGLKAFCTFRVAEGIEDLRKCCGGNGYLKSSGLPSLFVDAVWETTAEGDFIVLMLQTARFLLKSFAHAKAGGEVLGPVSYLAAVKKRRFSPSRLGLQPARSAKDFKDLDYLLRLYQARALFAVATVAGDYEQRLAKGQTPDLARNALAVELVDAVRAHCYLFLLSRFSESARKAEDAACREALVRLAAFFGVAFILEEQWAGLGAVFGPAQLQFTRQAMAELMEELRPNACALVDAFDIPDRVLNSALGRHDGNVYEALFEAALRSPLNQCDPFLGYAEVLRPRLDIEELQRGNAPIKSDL